MNRFVKKFIDKLLRRVVIWSRAAPSLIYMWTMDGGLRFDVLAAVTMAVLLSAVLRRIAVLIEELESSRNSGQLLRRLSASPVQQQPPSQPPPLELPETVLPRAVTNDTAVTETVSSPLLVCLRCLPGPIHHLGAK